MMILYTSSQSSDSIRETMVIFFVFFCSFFEFRGTDHNNSFRHQYRSFFEREQYRITQFKINAYEIKNYVQTRIFANIMVDENSHK